MISEVTKMPMYPQFILVILGLGILFLCTAAMQHRKKEKNPQKVKSIKCTLLYGLAAYSAAAYILFLIFIKSLMDPVLWILLWFAGIFVFGLAANIYFIKRKKLNPLYTFSVYVFLLILSLRFMVISSNMYPESDGSTEPSITETAGADQSNPILTEFEEDNSPLLNEITGITALPDSILHSLQSFSMDEDYTSFLLLGRQVLSDKYSMLIPWYELIFSLLNIMAPLLGGSMIIQILADFFPKLRLVLHFKRPKIVFSELNSSSIYLAEDLVNQDHAMDLIMECWKRNEDSLSKQKTTRKEKKKVVVSAETQTAMNTGTSENTESDSRHSFRFKPIEPWTSMLEHWPKNAPTYFHNFINKPRFKPLIIFTDTYPDQENEEISELIDRAKAIKAICLKTDIRQLNLKQTRQIIYFLMDEIYGNNLETYLSLVSPSNAEFMWPKNQIKYEKQKEIDRKQEHRSQESQFSDQNKQTSSKPHIPMIRHQRHAATAFLFVDDAESIDQIRRIQKKKDALGCLEPVPVRDYRNMAFRLCKEVPFFSPLLLKKTPEQTVLENQKEQSPISLTISIIGDGKIALEMFKVVFWSCQIPFCQLTLNCLCADPERFISKIRIQMPELLRTCQVTFNGQTTPPEDELLQVYSKNNEIHNPPYGTIEFFQSSKTYEIFNERFQQVLTQTDYFILATGSDESAIKLTNSLDKVLTRENMKSLLPRSRFIVPVIFNPALSDSVCRKTASDFVNYILPTGTLDSRISYDALFCTDLKDIADLENEGYAAIRKVRSPKGDYTTWTNIAKTLHAPYKLFGLGMIEHSSEQLDSILKETSFFEKYQKITVREKDLQSNRFKDNIAWIEKRRWNAYLRTLGFCSPTPEQYQNLPKVIPQEEGVNSKEYGDETKSFLWKLQSCLCEIQLELPQYTDSMLLDGSKLDRLDELSWNLFTGTYDQTLWTAENFVRYNRYFKLYDKYHSYPTYDFDKKEDSYASGGDKALQKILRQSETAVADNIILYCSPIEHIKSNTVSSPASVASTCTDQQEQTANSSQTVLSS